MIQRRQDSAERQASCANRCRPGQLGWDDELSSLLSDPG